jgi:putative flippase GtrA
MGFGWGGAVAALTNLAVVALAREIGGFSVGTAYLLSFSVVLCLSFALCRYTVFRATHEDIRRQFAKFVLSSLVFRGVELSASYALYELAGVHYFLALLAVQVSSFFIKFFYYRAIVFSAGDSAST